MFFDSLVVSLSMAMNVVQTLMLVFLTQKVVRDQYAETVRKLEAPKLRCGGKCGGNCVCKG